MDVNLKFGFRATFENIGMIFENDIGVRILGIGTEDAIS